VPQRVNWASVPYCKIKESDHRKYKLEKGDIVIARTGATTGYNYTFNDNIDAVFASYLIRYRIDNTKANPFFIQYALKSEYWKGFVEGIIGGSAQPGANAKMFAEFKMSIPPLLEQSFISELLSGLDCKIDLLHRQNQTLEQLAETLFRLWFVEEAEDSWEVMSLGELFEIKIGRTPPRKEHRWFSSNPDDVKWVSIRDLGNCGIYIDEVSEYLTKEAIQGFSIPIIPPNTVLLSFKLTIGRVAITTESLVSNEAIAHFKIKDNSNIFSEFLFLFLKFFNFESLGSTSSIAEAVNSQMIKQIEMPVPNAEALAKFNVEIGPIFQKIKSNTIQIRTLTHFRDLLLPKLISGEVRIKNSDSQWTKTVQSKNLI
jgi:type I restriction enzyme S subunit